MALGASANLSVQSEAVLREQYASLVRQVPLMYALMFLNVLFLALVTADGESWAISFVAPLALTLIIAVRGATCPLLVLMQSLSPPRVIPAIACRPPGRVFLRRRSTDA